MKRILITGAGSYIGTSFENYIKKHFAEDYHIDTVDTIDDAWKQKDFSEYDSILHVAGIAHQKERKDCAHLYYKVNRDLALDVAKKAKSDGVKQFVFLSSMSVYGINTGIITKETKPSPKSYYGRSKFEAEQEMEPLCDDNFKICILRPPMVYGKGCKGNFNRVCNLVKKMPILPNVKNKRSMLYIDNLSSFIKLCIDKQLSGVFYPQNREYVATVDMACAIAQKMNKTICLDYITGFGVMILKLFFPTAQKAFGTLIYQDTEDFDFSYIVAENEQSYKDSI